MALTLDHIVIAVKDLEQTITDYRALGFNVLQGGEHPGRPTYNALVVLADGAYFELIAWRSPSPGDRWWELLNQHGDGIVDFALLPPGTAATVSNAQARGLAYSGPHDGGRLRPDGERLQWQTARPPSADLPFLCGDLTPRALRVPEGDARVHPNGARGVLSLSIAVEDLDASLAHYRALLGETQAAHIGTPLVLPGAGARVATIALGTTTLVLTQPTQSAAPHAAGAQQLATRGPGPFAVVLGASLPAAQTAPAWGLDQTHGAAIELAVA
ncbi:glyoxalase [Acidovorax sp. Root275]|uniref:VOC family protein n=1 Tax=Acidovorax sp. Root275 TaxID=1736508 RepID=UPI00070D00DC|nr:VOC family protein [Acidovorax sp. Root275]KRD46303.1 glyoxalase [Acidovorax sp. Root275]